MDGAEPPYAVAGLFARRRAARADSGCGRFLRMDRATVAAACFAACVVILLLPVCVRYMSSMESVRGGDAGEYLALAQRYCEDRDLGNLLEKDDTTGHFRGHSHFPSLELYMSYGLFHTGGEVGYPNDKAVFTGLGHEHLLHGGGLSGAAHRGVPGTQALGAAGRGAV